MMLLGTNVETDFSKYTLYVVRFYYFGCCCWCCCLASPLYIMLWRHYTSLTNATMSNIGAV